MKPVDIVLLIIIAAVISAAIVSVIKSHKNGKECGCGCSFCSKQCGKRRE